MSKSSNLTALSEETYQQAITELSVKDSDLAGVILKWGNPPFWIHAPGFPGIIIAILAQQVSLESAQATFTKLEKAIFGFSATIRGAAFKQGSAWTNGRLAWPLGYNNEQTRFHMYP